MRFGEQQIARRKNVRFAAVTAVDGGRALNRQAEHVFVMDVARRRPKVAQIAHLRFDAFQLRRRQHFYPVFFRVTVHSVSNVYTAEITK